MNANYYRKQANIHAASAERWESMAKANKKAGYIELAFTAARQARSNRRDERRYRAMAEKL